MKNGSLWGMCFNVVPCLVCACVCRLSCRFSSNDMQGLDAAIARAEQATANVRSVFAWEPPEMRRCRDLRFALQVSRSRVHRVTRAR